MTLLSYYGASDSYPGGSLAVKHEHRMALGQVSPVQVHGLSDHSIVNHPVAPRLSFDTLPLSLTGRPYSQVEASPIASRLAERHSRITFVSYGLVSHLLLLPTPPYGDAVTVGYRPESVSLKRTSTSLTTHPAGRTSVGTCVRR